MAKQTFKLRDLDREDDYEDSRRDHRDVKRDSRAFLRAQKQSFLHQGLEARS